MSDLKFTILGNVLIRVSYILCVTAAAFHFHKPVLLWWYLLVLLIGYSYKTETKEGKDNGTGKPEE